MVTGKIYALIHPITKKTKYIGFTRRELKQRFSQHKCNCFTQKKLTHLCNWFKKLKRENLTPEIKLIEENIHLDLWEERENYWINQFENLTNQYSGGAGIHLNQHGDGRLRSINSKKIKIYQLNDAFDIIKEYDSIKEAELFINKKQTGNISKAIYKKTKAFGFYWAIKNSFRQNQFIPGYLSKEEVTKILSRPYFLYCIYTKKLIHKFNSSREVCKYLGIKSISSISEYSTKKRILGKHYLISTLNIKLDFPEVKRYIFKEKVYIKKVEIWKKNKDTFKMSFSSFYRRFYEFSDIKVITNYTEDIVRSLREISR